MFLARGLTEVPDAERGGHPPEHEEAQLAAWPGCRWMQAVPPFLAGDLHNGVTAVGILSAYAARQGGFAVLRESRGSAEG